MYFESKNTVLGSDTDTNANLSILAALQKLQDNICFFFGSIRLDQITLKEKYHAAWIFSKNKLKIFLILAFELILCFPLFDANDVQF